MLPASARQTWIGRQEIGRLLSDRSQTLGAAAGREGAGILRGEIIAAVNEVRAVLGTERIDRPELPATLDGDLFGYFDELQRLAAARNQPAAKPAPTASTPGTPAGTQPTNP